MSNDQTLLFAVDPGTHSATITDLLPLGDGASVVTVAMDKRIRWWNADDDKPVTILGRIGPGTDGAIDAAAVHTADGIVCVAAHDGATGRSTLRFRVPWLDRWQRTFLWDGRIADLAMSPDDRFLVVATAGSDRTGSDGGTDARLAVFRFDDLVPYDESTDSGVADYGTPADDAAGEYAVEDDAAPGYAAEDAAEAEFQLDRATDILAPPPPLFEIPLVIGPANVAVGPMVDGGARIVVTPTFIGVPQLFALTDDGLTELPVGGSATLDGRSDDGPERDRTDRDPTGGAANGSAPSVGLRASVAVSSHFVAIAGENSGLTILDHDGRVVAEAVSGAGGGSPVGVAFSPDGERLIVGSRAAGRSEVTVHDVAVDFPIVGRRRYDDNAIAVAFAGEDEVVTAGGSRFSVHRWDPTTSEPSAADRFIDGAGQVIDAVGLSGREVGFGNPDPVRPDEPRGEVPTLARRFNLDLLTLVPGAEEPEQEVPLEEFRRARHRTSGGGELELARGQVFVEPAGIELADGVGFSSDQASGYSVIPGDRVVVGRRSGAVGLFPSVEDVDGSDVPRFRPIARLVGHVSAVLDVVADERWLVTGGRDQVIRLWPADPAGTAAAGDDQIATVEPTLSLFITATNEWVIWTRSGYYASSPNGDRYISYHHNRGENQPARAYSGDQFVKNLYRPDIIRHVLEHQSEAAALDALGVAPIDIEDSLPPHVRILNWDTSADDPSIADLAFEVVDAARPTTTIVILQNGIPAVEIDARDQPGRAVDAAGRVRRYSEVIFLEPGRNELSVIAENGAARSTVATLTVEEPIVSPPPVAVDVGGTWIDADVVELPVVAVDIEEPDAAGDEDEDEDFEAGLIVVDGVVAPDGDVDIPTDLVTEGLVEEAIVEAPALGPNGTRGRVTGAELSIRLTTVEGDEPVLLTAYRNQDVVWQADGGPGVGFDGHLLVPLEEGYNEIEVIAEGTDTNGILMSGGVEVFPQDERVDPPTVDEGGSIDDSHGAAHPISGGPTDGPPLQPLVPVAEGDQLHVVADGETLRSLAKHYYGHESRYPLIFEANPQLIDLDRVPSGTELVIPPLRTVSDDDLSSDEVDLAGWQAGKAVVTRPQRDPSVGGTGNGTAESSNQVLSSPPGPGDVFSSEPLEIGGSDQPVGRRKGTGGSPRDLPPDSDTGTPNLYLLAIGVSNLKSRDEGFENLSWPGDDAAAIADRFKTSQGEKFGQVHQIGLGPRNVIEGSDATKANIEQAVDDLAAAVQDRAQKKRDDRVGTTDVTVVFFSGHGMSRVANEGEQEGLFLIPHDYDSERWQETSVSLLGVAETLCTLPKTELIIFIDACRSGFAGTDIAQRIKPEQFGKRVEAISPRTIYVLSSTARDLDSWEFGLKYPYDPSARNRTFVGHGLFTHAILKRMDEADRDNRGLSVLELGAAVHRQFETWRSWKAFADINVRQDPWYQFHRSVRHFEFYKKRR